jgi:hypothetical protein
MGRRTPRQQLTIRIDLTVDITDADTLHAAALAGIRDTGAIYPDEESRLEDEQHVASSTVGALLWLLDPDRLLDGIAGVEPSEATMREHTPAARRTLLPAPPARATPQPTRAEEREGFIGGLLRDAARIHGIDFPVDPDEPVEGEEPRSAAQVAADDHAAALIRGLLFHASVVVTDYLFADISLLRELSVPGGERITSDDIADTLVLAGLPTKFDTRYSPLFAQRLLIALTDVSHMLATGWGPLPTLAHELALRVLLDQAEATADLWDLDLPAGWRAQLEDELTEDGDADLLYSHTPYNEPVGEGDDSSWGDLEFEWFFVPFNDSYGGAPYAEDHRPGSDNKT